MRTRPIVLFLAAALLGGCAVSKTELAARAQLDRARAAYREAQADPAVQTYAQLRLADAQRAVQAAEQADHARDKLHLAYIAERRAQIASLTGVTSKTEQDTLQLGRETTEALLKKRERELQAARADLAAREREAEQGRSAGAARGRAPEAAAREGEQARAVEQARMQAEQARAQVEQARAQAEQARAQAEQARRQAEAEAKARAAEEAKAAALSKELSELKAKQTDRGLVLNLSDVLFAAGKAEVAPGGQRSIDQLAEFLKRYPQRRVLIEGHTDNIGNEDFNIKLSQQRAEGVRNLLVSKGVAADRITARGYGPKYPIVENDTSVGRQQNRRVEVLVLTEGASVERSSR
jgi:outer membrane protein OmpA-like peptidoglycan-associated protein